MKIPTGHREIESRHKHNITVPHQLLNPIDANNASEGLALDNTTIYLTRKNEPWCVVQHIDSGKLVLYVQSNRV